MALGAPARHHDLVLHLPMNDVPGKLDALPRDREIIVLWRAWQPFLRRGCLVERARLSRSQLRGRNY